ncbi:hypothetical protein [Metamycoplasma alkalescens]|uniref:Uncharacterized protein n=1 Tax=Metamycoplasma alkalescens TaxID=45363 RepID=A0A318U5Q2_9BACT|nr:hypothetical protein [Metamycoplasma alkalescens]PYF42253.1 hypothetical protein BCF88_11213 [Metamycoplasma alkalescens]SYV90149.1 Uncharacterised protein [Metamycoplasma alkalescens]
MEKNKEVLDVFLDSLNLKGREVDYKDNNHFYIRPEGFGGVPAEILHRTVKYGGINKLKIGGTIASNPKFGLSKKNKKYLFFTLKISLLSSESSIIFNTNIKKFFLPCACFDEKIINLLESKLEKEDVSIVSGKLDIANETIADPSNNSKLIYVPKISLLVDEIQVFKNDGLVIVSDKYTSST